MNRIEAKQHWRTKTTEWKTWAESLITEVANIENECLRHCVAGIIDSCASGYGNVVVRRRQADGLNLVGFFVDHDVEEALRQGVLAIDPEADYKKLQVQADAWLKVKLKNKSALQIAWTIGPLQDENPWMKGGLKQVMIDNIIYDITKGQFLGVKYDQGIYKGT